MEEGTGGTDDYQREPTKQGSKTHRNAQRPQSNRSIYTCCLYYFSNTTKVNYKLLFTCIRKDTLCLLIYQFYFYKVKSINKRKPSQKLELFVLLPKLFPEQILRLMPSGICSGQQGAIHLVTKIKRWWLHLS